MPGVVLAYSGAAGDAEQQRLWRDDHAFLAWSEGAGASVIASQLKVGGLVLAGTSVGKSSARLWETQAGQALRECDGHSP